MTRWFRLLLATVALVGLAGRLWNLDFDQRQHLHPDERFWALTSDALAQAPAPAAHGTVFGPALDWLDGRRSSSSPYRVTESFLYGPIALTVTRSVAGWLHDGVVNRQQPANAVTHLFDALGVPLIDDKGAPRFDDRYQVDLVGRLIGALIDTATIVLIGLIGLRVGGRLAGLAAAGLYASCVMAIQYAHFFGSEPLLSFACALTVLAALRLDRSSSLRRAATSGCALGVAGGLVLAAKLVGFGLVVVPVVGAAALVARHRRRSDVVRLGAIALGVAVTFRVLEPSAFRGLGIGFSTAFRNDLHRAAQLRAGTSPPSFQWANRTPVLEPLFWLTKYALGPGVTLAAALGATVVALRLFGTRLAGSAALPARRGRVQRLATGAGRHIDALVDAGTWPLVLLVSSVVVPFVWVCATAYPTGRYFFPMLPALMGVGGLGIAVGARAALRVRGGIRRVLVGSVVATLALSCLWAVAFVHGVYATTNTRITASRWIVANVTPGSVLSSEAWDDGLPLQLPGVDSGEFAFEQLNLVGPDDEAKVAILAAQLGRIDYVIESSPRIWATVVRMPARFPSTIKFFDGLDSGALGFQRVATFRSGPALGPWRLDESAAEEAFSVYDHPEVRIWRKVRTVPRDRLVAQLDPVAASNAVAVDPNHAGSNGLLLEKSAIAANTAGPTYDQAFDTSGSNLMHVVGWFALLELFGLAAFVLFLPLFRRLPDAGLGLSKILALMCLAIAVFFCVAWLKLRFDRGLVVVLSTAFVVAGASRARRRADDLRHIWSERRRVLIGVEVVTASVFLLVVLTRALNPDLWHPFRGGEKPFEMAVLTAVLRTRTLPVYDPWFSHGALNYYYGGWLLLAAPARLLRTSPALVMNLAIGVFASCTAGAAFTTVTAMVSEGRRSSRCGGRQRIDVAAGALGALFVLALGNTAILGPLWRRIAGHAGTTDWWSLSRVIPDSVAITEFPAWSLLFGDLHPHLMDIAPLLTCVALCLVWYHSLLSTRVGQPIAVAALLGAGIGLVRMTNTWDFPICVVAVATTATLALLAGAKVRRLVVPVIVIGLVVVVGYAPYLRHTEVFDAGFEAATLRTPPLSWFRQFGFFVAIGTTLIVRQILDVLSTSRVVLGRVTRANLTVVGLSVLALVYIALRPGFEVFEFTTALAIGSAWTAWRRCQLRVRPPDMPPSPVGPLVMALGWAIQAAVEYFTVRNDAGRTNTVFKFWYQSWTLLAIGAAAVVAAELSTRGAARRAAACAVVASLVLTGAFWGLTLPVRTDDRLSSGGLSLAGESFLTPSFAYGDGDRRFVPSDDMALVSWIRGNVEGIQVVAEAPGVDYQWTGRVAWLTGLPTPIGWPYHESQQRRPYNSVIDSRKNDMTALYTTTDPGEMARVLARYSVAYLVFGTQERLLATSASADALRSFECLSVMTTADRTTPTSRLVDEFFVAAVDRTCVNRLRPALGPPPPAS